MVSTTLEFLELILQDETGGPGGSALMERRDQGCGLPRAPNAGGL